MSKKIKMLMALAVMMLPLGSILSPGVFAKEHGGEQEHGGADHHAKSEKITAPKTLPGIWQEVREKQMELNTLIQREKLAQVHPVAFAIRDLVKEMPEKSTRLSSVKAKKLQSSISRIENIAALLDQYGDAGNKPKTLKQSKRLGKMLDYIEDLYPEGVLKESQHEEGGHHGH